jgi:SOS response regulatory protein OraA/RecX
MVRKRTNETGESALVTAIEPLASDPTRRRILVETRIAATLPDHEVDRLGIRVGTPWTAALAAKVAEAVALAKARTKALMVLGQRACTHGEMMARLTKAKCEPGIARAVADELVEQGWIDDAKIADDAARMLTQHMVSLDAIAAKLQARHLTDEMAEGAAAGALAEVDPVEKAASFIRKKLGSKRGKPGERDVRRILAGLSRKGFQADDVKAAFRRLGIDLGGMLDDWDG